MTGFKLLTSLVLSSAIVSCGSQKNRAAFKSFENQKPTYRSTRWLDGRPKLILDPENQPQGLTYENLVRAWITQESAQLNVSPRLTDLRLNRVRRSAKGIHYEYVTPDGTGYIHDSVLMVSVSLDGSRIFRAYNGIAPKDPGPNPGPESVRISKDQAISLAWTSLKVSGALLQDPYASLILDNIDGAKKLWWLVNIDATAPAGSWQLWIDARTGQIGKNIDQRLYDISLDDAKSELRKRRKNSITSFESEPAQADAKIFVVAPNVALPAAQLNDDSPAKDFDPVYETMSLDGVSKTSKGFELSGRRVALSDWDAPFSGVSITSDGHWKSERGQNSFNDAMTWWHLNESVKTLERIGYHDESKIFQSTLIADSDGFDGQDNSFFTPTINALSFGHGCIDDNEDPDVILHEMGHAINHAINPYFQGGDTGAMGEGFGDYWAVSYGFGDPRNRAGDRFKVFNWDGSSNCWDGRRADRENAQFKRGQTYQAHDRGADGIISDEIWSTPLVMALDELLSLQIPKDDVDLIVIESQYGLAHSLTMTDWSNALVQTAAILFPKGPHADVFSKYFHKHLIMNPRTPDLKLASKIFGNAGKNGVPDPGETIHLGLEIFNIGDADALDVKAEISSKSEWAKVSPIETTFGQIDELKKVTSQTPISVTIDPNVACGKLTLLEAKLTSKNGSESVIPIDFTLGIPGAKTDTAEVAPNASIPDHNADGISSSVIMNVADGTEIREGFSVDVAITHPSVTDVKIVLVTPLGIEIVLKSFLSGERQDRDIIGNFPKSLHAVEDFSALIGKPVNGTWTLKVIDGFEGGTGKLLAWGIRNPTGEALCDH